MSDNQQFKPRFVLGAGWTAFGAAFNSFSGLTQEDLSVPPHSDDVAIGGRTEPIRLIENYPIGYMWNNFHVDAGVYVLPTLRIRNRFSMFINPSVLLLGNVHASNPTEEGPYPIVTPPYNRQRYASGHDAYTFVSVGNAYSDSLDIEKLLPLKNGTSLSFQVGPALTAVQHYFGWDRYAAVEFSSSSYRFYPGLHAGVTLLHDLQHGAADRSMSTAIHLGDVGCTLGFSEGAPLILLSASLVLSGEVSF